MAGPPKEVKHENLGIDEQGSHSMGQKQNSDSWPTKRLQTLALGLHLHFNNQLTHYD
ncbi:hypothetical protein BO79DRAFT_58129 [Aspergillus costaricaensis CBS 115574]|uniref:Uncharacterized protein n=1 Tax=Aspergillus costaricaensis CBS 115574 TaxID=1448317 RepID=A0ACD1I1G7_9EURO|nr:hypothetical protein BO79DRAFT_58129 [Aspergillus costaricaensis CBS 115574]RAK84340.1 hypothetical protein BO79DRAFT_58129 [Aspergillus costaricaensis CBS 115574]